MYSFLKKALKTIISSRKKTYDFNKSNPLGGDGERVDIQLQKKFNSEKFDIYQKNHFKRYEFAKDIISIGDICGDFACGTGYGSVLISDKADKVIGVDLDSKVINTIKERYKKNSNITFSNENLLNITYEDFFDVIISFETIEHFAERDIKSLLKIFSNSLKKNGKLIFSTPYNQEESDAALKLGFHLTFYIDEEKIKNWLEEAGFKIDTIKYQNYETHLIQDVLDNKEFIICVATKM